MADITPLHEQPKPVDFDIVRSDMPHAVMLTMPSGQLVAMMLIPEMTPEEVIFGVIPKFRKMTGHAYPVAFRIYPVGVEEFYALTGGTVLP